jgi:hypothetical protein
MRVMIENVITNSFKCNRMHRTCDSCLCFVLQGGRAALYLTSWQPWPFDGMRFCFAVGPAAFSYRTIKHAESESFVRICLCNAPNECDAQLALVADWSLSYTMANPNWQRARLTGKLSCDDVLIAHLVFVPTSSGDSVR